MSGAVNGFGLFPVPLGTAVFSDDMRHRYSLSRTWTSNVRSVAVFIGLNPSTATAEVNDPTITREVAFAKRWGHDALIKVNLFAWRSTDPLGLLDTLDPIGVDNDRHVLDAAGSVRSSVIACWGSHRKTGALAQLVSTRATTVLHMLMSKGIGLFCLGTNADGQPKHPLYLAATTPLRVFK